jgi:hypothetical protein
MLGRITIRSRIHQTTSTGSVIDDDVEVVDDRCSVGCRSCCGKTTIPMSRRL